MKRFLVVLVGLCVGLALLFVLVRLGNEVPPDPAVAGADPEAATADRDPSTEGAPEETPSTWRDVSGDSGAGPRNEPGEMRPARDLSIPRIPDAPAPPVPSAETPPGSRGEGGDSLKTEAAVGPFADAPKERGTIDDAPLVPPVLLRAAWVTYPKDALKRKAEAAVEVRILVGLQGEVSSVEVVDPKIDPALSAAAIESARSMKFRPATRGGRPVSVWYNYRFDFTLP